MTTNATIEEKPVIIYTDGACSGNPGPGGYGAVLMYGEHKKELSGREENTTNNKMELTAIIKGLGALKRPSKVMVYTDSNYVKDGITGWIHNWKKNGWKTANKKPVKNAELWQELHDLVAKHQIEWHWVKGHNGDYWNERADALARGEK